MLRRASTQIASRRCASPFLQHSAKYSSPIKKDPLVRGLWRGTLATGVVVAIGVFIFERMKKKKFDAMEIKSIGQAAIGGPFCLVDHRGKARSDLQYVGKFKLIYFGFTCCPDICPTELTKMGRVLDGLEKNGHIDTLVPLMISVDPWRDTVGRVREFVQDFHPRIVGMTGTPEQVMDVCKHYRIYSSRPDDIKDGDDYLVDHSVFMFLMDSEGFYVEHFGPDKDEDTILRRITWHIDQYRLKTTPQNPFSKVWNKMFNSEPPK